jgi:signal transduction histidine kinase
MPFPACRRCATGYRRWFVCGILYPVGFNPVTSPPIPILAMATAWIIGQSVRARRRYAEALRAQDAAQAVTAERLRIARELHDLVAHSVGVVAIQAGMGSRVMDTQPAQARSALRAIEVTSRETLAGLRRIVGGLRQADLASRPGASSPAPGLTDLDRLVSSTADAGVRVDLIRAGGASAGPSRQTSTCRHTALSRRR